MILGPKKLLQLVKTQSLVENLDERELKNPEGAGFDIRIGQIYKISGGGFLGISERKTPTEKVLASYSKNKKSSFELKPGQYYLMKTLEKFNLNENLAAHIFPRSTLYRCGVLFLQSQVSPGYSGELIFGLVNLSKNNVKIEMGARVAHIQFSEVMGGGSKYRGQWQGGRISAKKKEKQV